ncbi:senescence-specific cysteine protease SAG39-like [Henckelia pumila]|uniref:senescence-specific cysteine protease SAG39-like n=1 Tax=Henckelia pumila TaxID=405737 RepID=UPI003C6E8883
MASKFDTIICFTLLLILGMCSSLATGQSGLDRTNMAARHERWMRKYGRVYHDTNEKAKRFKIFKKNVEFIERSNSEETRTYKLRINEFADLKNDEFRAARNGYKKFHHKNASTSFRYEGVKDVPESMDWREKGAVTGVKNQGQCGSCWAFSTVAAMEGINQISTKKLISLSEQELLDCDRTDDNQDCHGGFMESAFKFIVKNRGLTTESDYPYQGISGTCNSQKEASSAATITGYENVPVNDESALLKAVANQPVSVSIDARGQSFQFYSSGVITSDCGTNLDHGVTAVGYGKTENGTKYWLVKNSWGSEWGEAGYVRVARDVEAKEGMCGIAMQACYPTVYC